MMTTEEIRAFFDAEEKLPEESGRGRKYRRSCFYKKERRQTYQGLKHCRHTVVDGELVPVYYKKYQVKSQFAKKQANRAVRRARFVPNGGGFKKTYESWNILDW